MPEKILTLCGSTRRYSVNSLILDALIEEYKDRAGFDRYENIDQLPHFNPDLDTDPLPETVTDLRRRIELADAVLICTPEYVFSLPGSFKNAIEWMVSTTVFTDKKVGLITASSSGQKAHEALQLVMRTVGAVWGQYGALLIQAPKTKISPNGKITDPSTHEALRRLMDELVG